MIDHGEPSFWQRHRLALLALAAVGWVGLIASVYVILRPESQTAISRLTVGALPVTCNLTGPIACMTMNMSKEHMAEMAEMQDENVKVADNDGTYVARFQRYSGWPELKEALMAGQVGAAYLLAPLAMDLADRGIPVRIVALGHRSGAVIMVNKNDPAKTIADLRGRRVAIPSRFAVDHLFVRRLMKTHGLKDGDLKLIEIAPPEMPAALHAGAVDAYATGEPFGGQAERDGVARVLHWTREDWPTYVCCVLAVRTDLTRNVRPLIQELVDSVLSAGVWLESGEENRVQAAQLAARPEYFNQDPKLLEFVLKNPRDRVTYGNLAMIRTELDELMQLGLEAGIIDHPIPYETYVDDTFIRRYTPKEIHLGTH